MELKGQKIWVAGETGLVGRAMLRRLRHEDCTLLSAPRSVLDLTQQRETLAWMMEARPDIVVMAAARVGGIGANATRPAEFIADNLSMAQNVIDGAYRVGVKKLVFLGSSCIYPKYAPQPIAEQALLTGPLEETNEAYAIAKIAGLKMCQAYRRQYGCDFISVMPTNLYGPEDRFDAHASHVIPAMMLKISQAMLARQSSVEMWGTGTPLREFLYADDLADAIVFLIRQYSDGDPINIGSGEEMSIAALAAYLKDVIGYKGDIVFNTSYPDGTPRKRLDCARLNALGWRAQTMLEDGLTRTWAWYSDKEKAAYAA